MKLRVGLIGLGDHWQSLHRPALRMLHERFDVRAIYCSVSKLAENAVAEFQADPVDGYQAMVGRDDIDAVLVLEQSWLKHLPALAACSHGKAIYWAGCLDFDPVTDAGFRRSVEDSGVAFMASFPRRFAPATLRLKELIATHLGPPRLLFCHKRLSLLEQQTRLSRRGDPTDPVRSRHHEHHDGEHSTGAARGHIEARATMRNQLIELIDWCSYVVGSRAESVMSANCYASSPWDYRALSLRFGSAHDVLSASQTPHVLANSDAVTAQVSFGNYIPAKWQEAIGFRPPAAMQVCCENGVAFVDLPGTLVWFDDIGRHQESLESESPVGEKMLAQFHRAVTSLVRNLSGLEEAFQASAILRAAEQSSANGQRVLV
ncbi:Gfo/Idh/MocA family protein [Allorhodopirellula heiligendammensis]|uniref:Oxidoreductase family, NAD-binding Rossmann fold n=1 Tax=Allorhodopirellula heiligendammensis TaxID=2714739 RepID=A0A5C6C2E3_9BACT|nr:Gfo/Idh/MocA family oxidoreductase [Allorhodopirellula heiligendammensis]TWU17009.1 Oxidoreductase family, NAD-binding Rossmann fold [Allorhodopirellula heiligendammensis]